MNYGSVFIMELCVMQDDKYNAILEAASQVFSSEGFHKAKISKIAEIAGIGAGTVYLYFKNKEAILEEIFIRSWSRIEAKLLDMKKIKNMTPKQKISEIISEIIEMVATNVTVAKMILFEYSFWSSEQNTSLNEKVANTKVLIKELLDEGISKGEFRSSLNTQDTTVYIIGGVWFLLAYKSDELGKMNLPQLADELCNNIFVGIS